MWLLTSQSLTRWRHQGRHWIIVLLLIYLPGKDERLSWPSWLTCSGRFTHIVVTRRLQAEHRTGSVRRPKTGVLPTVLRNQHDSDDTNSFVVWQEGNMTSAAAVIREDDWLIDWVRLNVPPTHYRSYSDGWSEKAHLEIDHELSVGIARRAQLGDRRWDALFVRWMNVQLDRIVRSCNTARSTPSTLTRSSATDRDNARRRSLGMSG